MDATNHLPILKYFISLKRQGFEIQFKFKTTFEFYRHTFSFYWIEYLFVVVFLREIDLFLYRNFKIKNN